MKSIKSKALLLSAAITAAFAVCGQAQSVDALLDKLVDKGILSMKEANQLREESDKNFTTAFQTKTGMADWVQQLKLSGDVRTRYENFSSDNDHFASRSRFRYRLRFGATAALNDDMEAGFRFTTSEPSGSFGGDPLSGNTSFQDNGAKKFIYMDLVYGRWTPFKGPNFTGGFTVGKMENPFVIDEMVFDPDYTPEGIAGQFAYRLNDQHSLKANLGAFVLDELSASAHDPYLFGAQVRWDAAWTPKLQSTLGMTFVTIDNKNYLNNTSVPNGQRGNTHSNFVSGATGNRSTNQVPAFAFNPFIVDAAVTYTLDSFPMYAGAFPIKISGEYINNPGADSRLTDNTAYDVGITFGKAGKKGTWELGYTWKWLGADAWWEELVDSDFGAYYAGTQPLSGTTAGYGGGTNVKGHVIRLVYSPTDSMSLSAKLFLTKLINPVPAANGDDRSGVSRLQVDAMWKF